MGTDITPEHIRAFVVPHDITIDNLWEAESTFTDSQTQPAAPKPDSSYELGLTASGSFDATDTLRVQTQRAGHIGRASFVWREKTETDFYGINPPNVISRWESIVDGSAALTTNNVLLDALGNDDGTSILLYQFVDTSITNERRIRAVHRAKNGTLTTTTIYTQTDNAPTLQGGLCKLQDGSILAVYMEANDTNNIANLRSARSYDNGQSWNEQSSSLLPEDITINVTAGAGVANYVSLERIRIAESKGEILLIIAAAAANTTPSSADLILQYVSTDNGCSFVDVGVSGGSFAYFRPDLVVKNNVFFIAYIGGTGSARFLQLESATQTIDIARNFAPHQITNELVAGGLTQGHFTEGELSAWINDTGRVYAAFYDVDTDKKVFILQSDDGENWFYLGGNPTSSRVDASKIYDINDATSRPSLFAGCNARGVQNLYHNYETATHTRQNGIHLFELGNYSTVTQPQVVDYPRSYDFGGYDYTWVSYDTPDATAHYTKTGSGTITATATHSRFDSTNPNSVFVSTPTFTSTRAEGIIIRTRLKVVSQGHNLSGRGINILTNDNDVSIYISTNEINVADNLAGSNVGSLTTTVTTDFEILVSINDNSIKVWTCTNRDTPGEKRWNQVASGSLNGSRGGSNNQIKWGHLSLTSGAVAAVQTDWHEFHYSFGGRTGNQIRTQQNPEQLNSLQYPPRGKTVYLTGGTKISTYDGPTYEGEHWEIEKDSLYPLRRVFHSNSPTPRTQYRSANDTSEHKFSFFWDRNTENNANMDIGSNSIAFFIGGKNFEQFDVDVYDVSTTSWTNLGTVRTKIGGTTFTRTGASVVCTNASGEYMQHNELEGYLLSMGSGIVRRIKSNTAGYMSNTTTAKRCVVQLEDAQNTDPTSITGFITPPQSVAVFHLAAGVTGAAFRIKIPAQDTPDNYFTIGALLAGIIVPTQQYSNGRTISYATGTVGTETQDGVRRTHKNFNPYRILRIAWTEGIDISQIYDNTTEADYYTLTTATGAKPVATPSDTPTTIVGMFQQLKGEQQPLVYIPNLTKSVKQATTLQRRDEFMYCTIQEDSSIEHVLGDELQGTSGEVFRVATINLREIT